MIKQLKDKELEKQEGDNLNKEIERLLAEIAEYHHYYHYHYYHYHYYHYYYNW